MSDMRHTHEVTTEIDSESGEALPPSALPRSAYGSG